MKRVFYTRKEREDMAAKKAVAKALDLNPELHARIGDVVIYCEETEPEVRIRCKVLGRTFEKGKLIAALRVVRVLTKMGGEARLKEGAVFVRTKEVSSGPGRSEKSGAWHLEADE